MEYTGKTALVTGASSGIGTAIATAFAARGANLVLVARRQDRLDALAHELQTTHGISATVIALDLSLPQSVADLQRLLASKRVTIDFLINNAGFGTNSRFINEDRKRVQEEIALNVATLVDLTAALLPGMLERNFGAVVNIASTASFQPVPGMAVYGATKAFVRSFTEAVWGELGNSQVRMLAVSPGSTESEFFIVAGAEHNRKSVPASDVAVAMFTALDRKKSTPSVVVGGVNGFVAGLVGVIPKKFKIRTVAKMFLPQD